MLSCSPFIFENKHDVIQGLELGRTQCKGRVAGSPWFTWCNPGVEITTHPVYTVCASAVISPLRQWLDSYAKTRFKMCHTFKHLLICNTFCCRLILLSLSLYIELALVCCTNPNIVNCFGTIFPNLNFVFASIWAASPVHIGSDQYRSCSTVKQGCPRRIRPQITRLSQLRTPQRARGQFTRTLIPTGSKNGVI